MIRFPILILALSPFAGTGCIPLIMAGVAHSREEQARADQDNTLTCWQNYRDQVEALPDVALRGMKAQQESARCHDVNSNEVDDVELAMCDTVDERIATLNRQYARTRSDSREVRKQCERMDLQSQRSTAAAQNARQAAVDAANAMAANRSVYCSSNRIGNTVTTWCN